jgi:glycosyltransferase involved in cell wall biosynthesis
VTPAMLNFLTLLNPEEVDFQLLLLNNIIEWTIPENIVDKITSLNQSAVHSKCSKLKRLIIDSLKIIWLSRRYDVILLNGDLFQLTIPAFLSKLLFRKKTIYWIHICLSEVKYYPNKIFKLIHAATLRYGNAYVFCSYRSVDSFCRYTNLRQNKLTNLQVIYNILTRKTPNIIKSQFLRPNALHVLAIGRLVWEKNFTLLIAAVDLVNKKYNLDCELIICGEGDEFTNLNAQIVQLGLTKHIQLVGAVAEPFAYLAMSDVLVSSSYDTESLPMVVGEALLCNKPVIATKTGAAEILEYGKYGLVVEVNDKEQLAGAINKMADSKLREYYASLAPEALIRFNPETIMAQWNKLLQVI